MSAILYARLHFRATSTRVMLHGVVSWLFYCGRIRSALIKPLSTYLSSSTYLCLISYTWVAASHPNAAEPTNCFDKWSVYIPLHQRLKNKRAVARRVPTATIARHRSARVRDKHVVPSHCLIRLSNRSEPVAFVSEMLKAPGLSGHPARSLSNDKKGKSSLVDPSQTCIWTRP